MTRAEHGMADELVGFSPEGAGRIIKATRYVESQPRYQRSRLDARGPRGPNIQLVKPTSTTPTNGRYPGTLSTYTPSAETFTEGPTIWIVTPDGRAPQLDHYEAKEIGQVSGVPIFMTLQWVGAPPTGTVSLVTDVTCSSGTLTVTKQLFQLMDLQLLSNEGSY